MVRRGIQRWLHNTQRLQTKISSFEISIKYMKLYAMNAITFKIQFRLACYFTISHLNSLMLFGLLLDTNFKF